MTNDELDKQTAAARDRMAMDFAAREGVGIIVMAWDPNSGDVSCSAGGMDGAELPEFLRRSAAAIEQQQKAKAGPPAGKN